MLVLCVTKLYRVSVSLVGAVAIGVSYVRDTVEVVGVSTFVVVDFYILW